MSEELKACPLCKSDDIACAPIDGYAIWHVVCRKCGAQARGRNKYQAIALWNTRPIEDGLRAELAEAQAKVENLRELIQHVEQLHKSLALVDDALNSYAEFYGRAAGLAGLSDDALPSTTTDEIILRKIAEHDEVERLRGIIREVQWSSYRGIDYQIHYTCSRCGVMKDYDHQEYCPFYQWEGTP